VVAVLAVLAGGGVLAGTWVLQQYYVGAADGQVAIYQGVRGNVLGLPLQRVAEKTEIALTDLPETTRSSVEDGLLVPEGGLDGARERVAMLRGAMLVPCPAPEQAQPPAGAPPGALPLPTPTQQEAPQPGATQLQPQPQPNPAPTVPGANLPGPTGPGALPSGVSVEALPPTVQPAVPGATPDVDTTPLAPALPVPGRTCRETG
jgi:protein phosphatase